MRVGDGGGLKEVIRNRGLGFSLEIMEFLSEVADMGSRGGTELFGDEIPGYRSNLHGCEMGLNGGCGGRSHPRNHKAGCFKPFEVGWVIGDFVGELFIGWRVVCEHMF